MLMSSWGSISSSLAFVQALPAIRRAASAVGTNHPHPSTTSTSKKTSTSTKKLDASTVVPPSSNVPHYPLISVPDYYHSDEASYASSSVEVEEETEAKPRVSFLNKVKNYVQPKEWEGLSTKERLAKMGLAALLSYGFVTNMGYVVTISLSWYIHAAKVRTY